MTQGFMVEPQEALPRLPSRRSAGDPALYATPDNPIPGQAAVEHVRTRDGLTLRVARWKPTARKVLGTVLIAQGRAEFIEKYFETVRELRRRGFHVVVFDWRGHGGSQRTNRNARKGHIRGFRGYRHDLVAVIDQAMRQKAPAPYYALGHSTGAAVLLAAAHDMDLPIRRMVLLAPLIDLKRTEGRTWPRIAATILRAFGLGGMFIPGGGETSLMTRPFAGNNITSDPVRYARNGEIASTYPFLAIGEPTVTWLASAFRMIRDFAAPRYPQEIAIPTLILSAGGDQVCSATASERFAARLKAGSGLVLPGARHELLMERDEIRTQVWAAFDAFIPGTDAPMPEPSASEGAKPRKGRRVQGGIAGRHDSAAAGG